MSICIITDDRSMLKRAFLRDVLHLLGDAHTTSMLYVPVLPGSQAYKEATTGELADIYLLKSHVPRTLEIARILEERGALVVNNWSSTLACQDRKHLFSSIINAGLPCPPTWFLNHFQDDLTDEFIAKLPFPTIMKCRYAYESLSVDKVDDADQLRKLAYYWRNEPVVLQEYIEGDGWDTKIWVVDQQAFAAKRRSPLADGSQDQFQIELDELGADAVNAALSIGKLFGLQVYVVDMLMTARGPMIVDVNPFPGFTGLFGPERALADFLQHALSEHQAKKTASAV